MTTATKRNTAMAGLLILWFAAAYVLGTGHYMINDHQSFLAPIVLTVALPVAIFLAAYGLWRPFRGFVLSQDIRTLTMLQG
jgi:cytosine/uracil/thiamine/allantoin permease